MASPHFLPRHRSRGTGSLGRRRGAVVVLAAFLMIAMLAMVAFALDMGYLLVARTELQRSADSAAMAAAWQLVNRAGKSQSELEETTREVATQYAAQNAVLNAAPSLDRNDGNASHGDVELGTVDDLGNPDAALHKDYPDSYNAVRVRVRRTAERNGKVPFFFARALGVDGAAAEATATAVIVKRVGGFRPPANGANLPILPIALDLESWEELLEGENSDHWSYTSDGIVESGSDGVPELVLYPESNNSPGNFGTIDIGPANNSTKHLSGQIRNGISSADLEHHGGELKLDDEGELRLAGDTGLSAGIKDELTAITGEARIIPVYREVSGSGNNAVYTIVKFVGVRIMNVELTGGEKGVVVQPADIVVRGTIPAAGDGTSDHVYSPAYLFQ